MVGVAKRAREIRDEAIKNEVLLDDKSVSMAIGDIYDGKFVVEEPEEIHTQKQKDAKNAAEQKPADDAANLAE